MIQFFINLYYRYRKGWGIFGDYPDWQTAERDCQGYDDAEILQRVKSAALAVKNGQAKFERDGFLFYENEEIENLTKALINVLDTEGGEDANAQIRVLDFGGSLGSLYFQHRQFLNEFLNTIWCVVEQKHFVDLGKAEFEDNHLKFADTIAEAVEKYKPNVAIFSSVLQYVEQPNYFLDEVARQKIPFIWIDRMAFWNGERDRFLKQIVSPEIYKASYPTRIFSLKNFKTYLQLHYQILDEFKSPDKMNVQDMQYLGFFAKKLEH